MARRSRSVWQESASDAARYLVAKLSARVKFKAKFKDCPALQECFLRYTRWHDD